MNTILSNVGFTIDKSKTLQCPSIGPKYIIITRNNLIDKIDSLNEVSPFLIKKVIDNVCGSEIDFCKKLRNGTILLRTKNYVQAQKLIQLTSFSPSINVITSEHNSLNFTKGVVYCNDLRNISENIILEELKNQNVVKVEKIVKKVDNNLIETGLIVVTFASLSLPEHILVGYEKIRVRIYIPRPMRCTNCWLYGHTKKFCKNDKICANCSKDYHIDAEAQEECGNSKSCKNCKMHGFNVFNHAIFDKSCPIFLKEKEIQAIMTLEKASRSSAISIYNQRNPGSNHSYARIANPTSVPSTPQTNDECAKGRNQSKVDPPKISVDYSDLSIFKNNINASTFKPSSSKKVTIVPRNTSRRAMNQLKKTIRTRASRGKSSIDVSDDSSGNNVMDLEQPNYY